MRSTSSSEHTLFIDGLAVVLVLNGWQDLRFDDRARKELLLRTEEFRSKLWFDVEERKAQATAVLKTIKGDGRFWGVSIISSIPYRRRSLAYSRNRTFGKIMNAIHLRSCATMINECLLICTGWLERQTRMVFNHMILLMQAEVERFHAGNLLLHDYYQIKVQDVTDDNSVVLVSGFL